MIGSVIPYPAGIDSPGFSGQPVCVCDTSQRRELQVNTHQYLSGTILSATHLSGTSLSITSLRATSLSSKSLTGTSLEVALL